MKKTVKFLSFVLLVTMLFSMMASSASAIVSDDTANVNGGGIVLGGGGNYSIDSGGSLVIGGDQRPEDDTPFTGARVDEDVIANNRKSEIEKAKNNNSDSVEAATQDALLKYTKKADGDYNGIIDSEYPLVQENEDFLMYVRDNIDNIDDDTLQTATNLFGDEAVYGNEDSVEFDDEAADADLEDLNARIEELEARRETLGIRLGEIEEQCAVEGLDPFEIEEYVALVAEDDSLVEQLNNLDIEVAGIEEAKTRSMSEVKVLMAPVPATKIVSNFSAVCPGYSSLAEAVASHAYNNVLKFNGNSFDICNSTDYRITVDLHASTIDARQSPAAFTIQTGKYGGTVTFTNGTIVGDGFYVKRGGVLNLGGLVNGNYVDITVFALRNAVYVEDGGTCVIGQGTTLVGGIPGTAGTNPADLTTVFKADNTKYAHYSEDPVVYVGPNGTVRMTGGSVIAGSVDGTGPARLNNCAIMVDGGAAGNAVLEISSSVAEVISNNPVAPAIYGRSGAKIDVHAGFIKGPTGIAVNGQTTTLSINGGAITGYAAPTLNWRRSGAAVEVQGTALNINTGTSPIVNITGGTLRSELTAGVVNLETDGTRVTDANRPLIKRIAVDDVNVTIQQKSSELSDYAQSKYLVTGANAAGIVLTSGYGTLNDAITAANTLTGVVTIKMIEDDTVTASTTPFAPGTGSSIVFDGNGHKIKSTNAVTDALIKVASGDVTIKNVYLEGSHVGTNGHGIQVNGGNVHIGPSVTVAHFVHGLHVSDSTAIVTVNGLDIESHNEIGIYATGKSQTIVQMCKDDSSIPVLGESFSGTGFLRIDGGWFANKQDETQPTNNNRKVATFVDPDTSYVKFVEKDNYYEVLYIDTPNVEIDTTITKRYGTETLKDGTKIPYIVYDKSNPDPIVFKEVMPKLKSIDAVPIMTDQDGKVIQISNKEIRNIKFAQKGTNGTIIIPDRDVLEDLPSGRYDLRFNFLNGYTMENKLRLYVFPKYAGLFAVPNNNEISPSITDPDTLVEFFNGNIVDYLNKNFDLIANKTAYPIGAINWNVAIVTSELPDKITIGNAADNTNSILLENYIYNGQTGNAAQDRTTWGVVPSGPYQGYYFYIISYADLNNLSAGQNWVFLNWNGMDGALKNLPLTIKNDYVSISPTKVDWSKIDNYVNFTVNPAPQTVYVDGELVPSGYWTYDASTKTLSIKGTYFAPLEAKEHTLEVVTGLGKASATVKTGMGLKANGIDYHVYGGNRVVNFQASDRINQDAGIWIGSSNPTKLDPSAYTWNGTNGFTLNPAFLNRLALGTYYISAYVYNGNNGYNYTTTTFRVISATQASNNPATGDDSNITLWLVILALSATALVVIIVPQFKKSKSMH